MAVGYGFSILGDFHLAEDAAQSAFVQAYRDLPLLRQPAAFSSWLRKLVFKHCDRLTRGKRPTTVALELGLSIQSEKPGPAEIVEGYQMQSLLHKAIQTLPEHQRQVIALFYISDYPQNKIAAFLDLPVTAVKKRLHDARKQLKERILSMVQEDLQENRPSKDNQFVDKVLELIEPKKEEHSEAIYALLEHPDHPLTQQWRQGRLAHSHLDWQTSRLGLVDNQVLAVFGVYDLSMRIGSAQVRTAGLNLDATHADCGDKEQELMKKTATAAIEAMGGAGYDLSVTFGNEDFFYDLGYVFAWRELAWYVDTDELPPAPPDLQLQPFNPNHRQDLAAIYNQDNERLTGTAVKPTYKRNKHPDMFQGWLWTDGKDNPLGYISGGSGSHFSMDLKFQKDLDQGQLSVALIERLNQGFADVRQPLSPYAVCAVQAEGSRWLVVDGKGGPRRQRRHLIVKAGDKLQVFMRERSLFWVDESAGDPQQCLQVLGILARQSHCDAVCFDRLHYKSALGTQLRQLRSCQIQPDTWGGLHGSTSYVIRIINLKTLFEKLAPVLGQRLRQSPLAAWTGNLVIANGEEEVMLVIDRAEVQVASAGESDHSIRGGQQIAQLVVGTETPDEIVETNGIKLKGQARQLIEILFPAQYPQMENQAL